MQPARLAAPHIADGSLIELLPDTPIGVTLYWTVARLHADALRQLTEAVRRAAGGTLAM
jgi:LysR family transcriptional regulator (chromosome initiation inhibitor)